MSFEPVLLKVWSHRAATAAARNLVGRLIEHHLHAKPGAGLRDPVMSIVDAGPVFKELTFPTAEETSFKQD